MHLNVKNKTLTTSIWLTLEALCVFHLVSPDITLAAHILEPLGTEIAATPPRGAMFAQIEYLFLKDDPEVGEDITTHLLPVEFEVGVGERTQLNFEASVLLKEKTEGLEDSQDGIEEMAFGLKHRFLDETETLPDAAFLVEFAPAAGLKGNEAELKHSFLFTKNITTRFLVHLETGLLHKTERRVEVEGELIGPGPGGVQGEGKVHVETANLFVYNLAPVFRVIPDRLLFIAELNGETNFKTSISHVTLAPEVILVVRNMSLKLAVPFGLTDESKDIGVHFGISKLFR